MWLQISPNDVITNIAVQLQRNDRLCCCIDYINCTAVDGWKKCTEGMAVATELVLQWHCRVCSTAIDCCSTGVIVALSAVQYSDRLLFYWC